MASIWEILDPSNLLYNTELGNWTGNLLDIGEDQPPTYIWDGILFQTNGWVRTGYAISSSGTVPGKAHCDGWTSNSLNENGTAIRLRTDWSVPAEFNAWNAYLETCDEWLPVWCVEDR